MRCSADGNVDDVRISVSYDVGQGFVTGPLLDISPAQILWRQMIIRFDGERPIQLGGFLEFRERANPTHVIGLMEHARLLDIEFVDARDARIHARRAIIAGFASAHLALQRVIAEEQAK